MLKKEGSNLFFLCSLCRILIRPWLVAFPFVGMFFTKFSHDLLHEDLVIFWLHVSTRYMRDFTSSYTTFKHTFISRIKWPISSSISFGRAINVAHVILCERRSFRCAWEFNPLPIRINSIYPCFKHQCPHDKNMVKHITSGRHSFTLHMSWKVMLNVSLNFYTRLRASVDRVCITNGIERPLEAHPKCQHISVHTFALGDLPKHTHCNKMFHQCIQGQWTYIPLC